MIFSKNLLLELLPTSVGNVLLQLNNASKRNAIQNALQVKCLLFDSFLLCKFVQIIAQAVVLLFGQG